MRGEAQKAASAPNKGMDQASGALAGMEPPLATHPQCSADSPRSREVSLTGADS